MERLRLRSLPLYRVKKSETGGTQKREGRGPGNEWWQELWRVSVLCPRIIDLVDEQLCMISSSTYFCWQTKCAW